VARNIQFLDAAALNFGCGVLFVILRFSLIRHPRWVISYSFAPPSPPFLPFK